MSAPSFTSFPPTFSSFPDLGEPSSRRQPVPSPSEDRRNRSPSPRRKDGIKDKHKRDKKRRKEKPVLDEDRHRRRSRSRSKKEKGTARWVPVEEELRSKPVEDTDLDHLPGSSYHFYSDRKGDQLNVAYGSLHAGSVPKHSLVGRGKKILGLSGHLAVVHRSSNTVVIGTQGTRKLPQLTDSGVYAALTSRTPKRLLPLPKSSLKYQEVDGILLLPSKEPFGQSDRMITAVGRGDSDASSPNDDGTEDSGSEDEADVSPLSSRQEVLRAIEQRITSEPSSISAWETLLDLSLNEVPLSAKNAKSSRSEITVSVLQRALKVSPENRRSAHIWLKYLKAGEEIWEKDKLNDQWEEALNISASADVWVEWLDWRIKSNAYGIQSLKDDGCRAMKLAGIVLPREDIEVAKLRLFWRIAVFQKDSGFVETANALFQAQAEFCFHMPTELRASSLDEQLNSLEEFWESEVDRVGEATSQGWAKWFVSNSRTHEPPHLPKKAEDSNDSSNFFPDPYISWAASETIADTVSYMPAKGIYEETDPYAIIMFSDIRDFIADIQTPRAKKLFRLIWLEYLAFHIPGLQAELSKLSTDDRWCNALYSTDVFISTLFPPRNSGNRITSDSIAGVIVGRERDYRSGLDLFREWGYGILEPLESIHLDGTGRMWEMYYGDVELVRCVFKQTQIEAPDPDWDILFMAFEATQNIKSALKQSRLILSKNEDNLQLWAAHARLERIRGRYEEAYKIYNTVISSGYKAFDLACIWWDYAELKWLAESDDQALDIIHTAADNHVATRSVRMLRSKRQLEDNIEATRKARWKDCRCWIRLRTLLELLEGSLEGALDLFRRYLLLFVEGSREHESLTVAELVMVYRYSAVLRHPCPPAVLRDRASTALTLYPDNTIALGLFLESQKGEGIWGRVRGLFSESVEGRPVVKSVARRLAEVWIAGWDKRKWAAEVERIRQSLEAAVYSDRTRRCQIIWQLYLECEIRAGELQRAKRILFRALGDFPLSKGLYLMAFGPLRSVFTSRELNALVETMAERGIRIRNEIEARLEGWKCDETVSDEETGDEAEGELERDAEELRRLMPY